MKTANSEQLTLALKLRDEITFDNFYPGGNEAILEHLQAGSERFIYLWGSADSGRTHLLQACCHALPSSQALYLDLAESALTPSVLADIEFFNLVSLDNIDAVFGQLVWEVALFNLFNRCLERANRWVVAASKAPNQLDAVLPDLQSRLSSGLAFRLAELNDEQKIIVLQMRASQRGLTLSTDIGKFLINRYPRDMGTLLKTLEILDQAALTAKRPLTIPFIKQILIN